jgi:hypothetical protein
MRSARSLPGLWSILTLSGTRSLLTLLRYRFLVGTIGLAYAVSAMLFAGMLYLPPARLATGSFFYIYPAGPGPAWMYPTVLAGTPYFELDLPFLSAILMTLSSAGVGLGMALAVFLGVRLAKQRKLGQLGPTAFGTAAGITPAMIALVTLGACCSTTAAATAGISLAAQSSGTSSATLLANTWYLGVFQVVVIYVALIAQEQLVRMSGFLVDGPRSAEFPTPAQGAKGSRFARPVVGSLLLRGALVVAGLTWSLSVFAAWTVTPPGSADGWTWFDWIVLHLVPGILGVFVGLSPGGALAGWARLPKRGWAGVLRATLVTSGVLLVTWVPFPASRLGAVALGNELLGFWGFAVASGAVAPPGLGLSGLLLRWGFQFALLGAFAIAVGISPRSTIRPLARPSSLSAPEQDPVPGSQAVLAPPTDAALSVSFHAGSVSSSGPGEEGAGS